MMRLPKRLSDPLAPAKSYVAGRVGLADQMREQRRLRALERQPRPDPGVSVMTLSEIPPDIEAVDINQVHRVPGGPGVADQILIRIKDATDTERFLDLGTVSIENITGSPVAGDLDNDQLYRQLGAPGVADTLIARMKNAANTVIVQTISLVGHLHAEYALLVHTHPYAPLVHSHPLSVLSPMPEHSKTVAAGASETDTVTCPAGYVCTGGGVYHSADGAVANISDSYPESNGWRARVFNGDVSALTMTVFAVCVPATVS